MKIKSTIPLYPTEFCRRMVSWCCKRLELPVREVHEVMFRKSSSSWGGLCRGHRIGVRLGNTGHYPMPVHRFPDMVLADRVEALIMVTAHELAHVYMLVTRNKSRRSGSWGGSERNTDWLAFQVLKAFRENREGLLADWNRPAIAKTKMAKPSLIEQRAAKVEKQLAAWVKKAKLAATKVKKYKAKVRYYEKKLSTAASPSPTQES